MIELCKQRFPESRWILEDMRKLKFQKQFDLVIAWHSLFHLPHEEQEQTLKLFTSLLKPSGLLVFTSGSEYAEEWSENGDYDLYHASFSKEDYEKILQENGLKILIHKMRDPNCGYATVWVTQKR